MDRLTPWRWNIRENQAQTIEQFCGYRGQFSQLTAKYDGGTLAETVAGEAATRRSELPFPSNLRPRSDRYTTRAGGWEPSYSQGERGTPPAVVPWARSNETRSQTGHIFVKRWMGRHALPSPKSSLRELLPNWRLKHFWLCLLQKAEKMQWKKVKTLSFRSRKMLRFRWNYETFLLFDDARFNCWSGWKAARK